MTFQLIESRKVWKSKREKQFWASDLSPGSQSWSGDEGVIKDCAIKEQSPLSLGVEDDDASHIHVYTVSSPEIEIMWDFGRDLYVERVAILASLDH